MQIVMRKYPRPVTDGALLPTSPMNFTETSKWFIPFHMAFWLFLAASWVGDV